MSEQNITPEQPEQPNVKAAVTASLAGATAAVSATLFVLVHHADENGSFSEPSTFVGMAVGVTVAAIAAFALRRYWR